MATGFKTATVNASSVPATQTDFPSYVDLSRLGITTLAEAQSVRVYADSGKTTEWAREIVSATEMHVKVPSLTSTVAIYVDWDGVSSDYAATDTYGSDAVWSAITGVWHMEDSVTDSTVQANNGSDTNVTYNTTKIGKYFSVSGTGWSTLTDSSALRFTGSYTISFWMRTTATDYGSIYSHMALPSNFFGIAIRMNNTSPNKLNWNHMINTGSSNDLVSSGNVNTGSWIKVDCVYDTAANTRVIYLNGSSSGSKSEVTDSNWTGTQYFKIGARKYGAGAEDIKFNGDIDEVRAIGSVRTANWIATEYNNQNAESTFWGTWSTVSGGGPTFVPKVQFLT